MRSPHPEPLPCNVWGLYRPSESEDKTFLICHVTTWLMCHVTLWVRSHHTKSLPCKARGPQALWKCRYNVFLLVTRPRYRSVTWLCGWGPLILSDHPAKFGVHRPYGTENNGVCNISSNSNSISSSNSNAEVPMPRFTNGRFYPFDTWCPLKGHNY